MRLNRLILLNYPVLSVKRILNCGTEISLQDMDVYIAGYGIKLSGENDSYFDLKGMFVGEYKANFQIPDKWKNGDYLCWCCFDEIELQCEHIW